MIALKENYTTETIILNPNRNVYKNKPIRSNIIDKEKMKNEVKKEKELFMKNQTKVVTTSSILMSILFTSKSASAEQLFKTQILGKDGQQSAIPSEIIELINQLILASLLVGVGVSAICLVLAGIYKVVGQPDKARTWVTAIIKGFGQILLAPVIIFILVKVTNLLFGEIPALAPYF